MRIKGEAYGLRALFLYHLLQNHGGLGVKAIRLLGVPLLLKVQDPNSDFNQPRTSFEACMKQIYSDLDKAEALLPLDYENIGNVSLIPAKYGTVSVEQYNRAFGIVFRGLLTSTYCQGHPFESRFAGSQSCFCCGYYHYLGRCGQLCR